MKSRALLPAGEDEFQIDSHQQVRQGMLRFGPGLKDRYGPEGCTRRSYHIEELQYDQDDSDYEQKMDPAAGFREARTNVPTEIAEQPQYY